MADFFLNEFIVNIDVAIYSWVDSIMNTTLASFAAIQSMKERGWIEIV